MGARCAPVAPLLPPDPPDTVRQQIAAALGARAWLVQTATTVTNGIRACRHVDNGYGGLHTRARAHTHTHTHTHTHIHTHTHSHTDTHTHTHARTHARSHARTHAPTPLPPMLPTQHLVTGGTGKRGPTHRHPGGSHHGPGTCRGVRAPVAAAELEALMSACPCRLRSTDCQRFAKGQYCLHACRTLSRIAALPTNGCLSCSTF